MANELIGMFGQSPEMTQLGLQQGRDANMAQLAQMSKGSMLAYGAGTAADRLGGAVGGMLGGTDPRMEEANLDKQIQQEVMMEVQQLGIDPTKDWEKFGTIAAQKYNAAGKPDKAFQISQAIEKMKATQAETGLKNAQAAKALKEKQFISVGDTAFDTTTGKYIPNTAAGGTQGKTIDERDISTLINFKNTPNPTPEQQAMAEAAWTRTTQKVSMSGQTADLSAHYAQLNPRKSVQQPNKPAQPTDAPLNEPQARLVATPEAINKEAFGVKEDLDKRFIPSLDNTVRNISAKANKIGVENIKGLGEEQNIPLPLVGNVGNLATSFTGSKDSRQLLTDIASFTQNLVKQSAGLSQTVSEAARTVESLALSPTATKEDFFEAYNAFIYLFNAEKEAYGNMIRPEVKDKLKGYFKQDAVPYVGKYTPPDKIVAAGNELLGVKKQQTTQPVDTNTTAAAARAYLKSKGY